LSAENWHTGYSFCSWEGSLGNIFVLRPSVFELACRTRKIGGVVCVSNCLTNIMHTDKMPEAGLQKLTVYISIFKSSKKCAFIECDVGPTFR